jgi:hypothetical protein
MQILTITALIDELDKIKTAASTQAAGYMQSRRGIRPYRVETLLSKNNPSLTAPEDLTQNPELEEPESDASDFDKEAAPNNIKEKSLSGFAQARPYAASAIKAAIPAALFGKFMAGEGSRGSKAARILGITGAGLGIADEALKNWAKKHKRKAVAQKILGTS